MRPERAGRHLDDGFALVEVLVALAVFLVVMSAVLPQILAGVRGSARAGQVTEQKGVVEAELELMRNLPWHVAPNAGQFIDVLDRYYPNLVAPPSSAVVNGSTCAGLPAVGWSGYVRASARCGYEPGSGPFYRTVKVVDPDGPGRYLLVVDAQFLDSLVSASASPTPAGYGPTPTPEPAVYDTTVQGRDVPPSRQIGVTVTSFDLRLRSPRPVSDYTQIAEEVRSPQRVQGVAEATAIELSGVTRSDVPIGLTAAKLELSSSLAKMSTASARLAAVMARWSTDDPLGLHAGPVAAPPSATQVALSDPTGGDLQNTGSCGYACWSAAQTSAVTVTADAGLPSVGSLAVPVVQAAVDSPSTALTFGSTAEPDRAYARRDLELRLGDPVVSVAGTATVLSAGCGGSGGGDAVARGHVTTSSGAVTSCAEAATSTVSLFPTADQPAGILQLRLDRARATCSSTHGGAPVATATFAVTVVVRGTSGTTTRTFTNSSTSAERGALQALLTTPVTASGRTLGDYVGAWSLATATSSTGPGPTASASVPAALVLTSTELRNTEPYVDDTTVYTRDDASAITVRLGAASCMALDAR